MKKVAIIVAAGKGKRLGAAIPKQFLLLNGKPILYYSIKAFLDTFDDIHVILVMPEEDIDKGDEIIDAYFSKEKVTITIGGDTRFDSVKNGIKLLDDRNAIVFVHDGVRCLITGEVIMRCFDKAMETGTAVPVIKPTDSLRIMTENGNEALDREKMLIVQTPQTFHSNILMSAFQIDYKEKFTDEASVVEAFGIKIHTVEGNQKNFKITHQADLTLAEYYLQH